MEVLGLKILGETFRKERDSYKLDLAAGGEYRIELFSFSNTPPRPSYPEAAGLRHLAFEVDDLEETLRELTLKGIEPEPVRIDEATGKRFAFFHDPDGLPLEIYEK
jgi:glyoxylase I family protein